MKVPFAANRAATFPSGSAGGTSFRPKGTPLRYDVRMAEPPGKISHQDVGQNVASGGFGSPTDRESAVSGFVPWSKSSPTSHDPTICAPILFV